ncbi:hypothetical protein GCM10009804_00840 [Kribbella hippodromi]|uniref:Uncharacterized protein n=1 Tax=Kribbella hippodromi TaxID=434347 RepID=A0ABP4MU81_9ACTN
MADPARARDRFVDEHRGIVDQDIDPAQYGGRIPYQGRDCGRIAEVSGDHRMALAGQSGANLFGAFDGTSAVQYDPVAGGCERVRGRRPDTSGRTGDEYSSGHVSSLADTVWLRDIVPVPPL